MAFRIEKLAEGKRCLDLLPGLAPIAQDSGKRRGQRCIEGGRAVVRCTLSMAVDGPSRRGPTPVDPVNGCQPPQSGDPRLLPAPGRYR